jgi:hypothetical protein
MRVRLQSRGEVYERMSSMVTHRCNGLRSKTLKLTYRRAKEDVVNQYGD